MRRLRRGLVAPACQAGRLVWLSGLLLFLAACSGAGSNGGSINIGNSQTADPGSVDYPIFYVKRTVPATPDDLRLLSHFSAGADLYMRAVASASSAEVNITSRVTAGGLWDVKDVDSSPDGSRVTFAMRGPLKANQDPKDAPGWRIWEYLIASDTLTPMIAAAADIDPATVQDVSPHYLPDGRIIFSSTRQRQAEAELLDEGLPQFVEQDEDRKEATFNLHTISVNRGTITQITFNQSHDRDATVMQSGRILFSRWDHTPGHDAMHLFSANPDGTDQELYYGANSHATGSGKSTIEFVKPREMPDGRVLALIRPYTDADAVAVNGITPKIDFGGDLVLIDGGHYVENTQALTSNPGLIGPAQTTATQQQVITVPGPSPGGRFSAAYPLWDGSGRILVSWTPCLLQNTDGSLSPCAGADLTAPTVKTAPPQYSIWIYSPGQNTFLPIMQAQAGIMITDIAAAQPRTPLPGVIVPQPATTPEAQDLASTSTGVIDIRSVYDVDGVDMFGIAALANGGTPASQRPARFLRLVKAVSIPDKTIVDLADSAFGVSNYMREIMGYVPVEPDGSVRMRVPANVAFQVQVLDANARQIMTAQGSWLQVAAGETVQCNGCHTPAVAQQPAACAANAQLCATARSHGRTGTFVSAYAGAIGGVPYPGSAGAVPVPAETMAQTRSRTTCPGALCSEMPSVDVLYTDVWSVAGATPNPPINLLYAGTGGVPAIPTTAVCESGWAATCRTRINYPEHIQPIWDKTPRPAASGSDATCTSCHNAQNAAAAGGLDLSGTASNSNPPWPVSYVDLLVTQKQTDANGNTIATTPAPFDAGNANGMNSVKSLERLDLVNGDTIHKGALSPAELRLISEWIDIGAQYFNNPFDPAVPVN